jgi:hypothetical protein
MARARCAADKVGAVMKIFLINLFGNLFVVVEQPGALTRRLAALQDWCSQRNFPSRQ